MGGHKPITHERTVLQGHVRGHRTVNARHRDPWPYALLICSTSRIGSNIIVQWNALTGISYAVQWLSDMEVWNDMPVGENNTWTETVAAMESERYYPVIEN